MQQAPFDKPLHGSMHFVEGGMKAFGHLRPTHSLHPVRKKLTMLKRGRLFVVALRNLFSDDAMLFARTSAHLGSDIFVREKDGKVPKGHEFEAAGATLCIVGGTFLTAFWIDGLTVFTRYDLDVDVVDIVSYFI